MIENNQNAKTKHIHGDRFLKLADIVLRKKSRSDYYKVLDWSQTNLLFLEDIPEQWQNPRLLYINTEDVLDFQNHIEKLQNPFVLLSHNSDTNIRENYSHIYNHPKLIHWFTQNLCVSHPKTTLLPIGFANPIWQHGNYLLLDQIQSMNRPKEIIYYANFLVETNRTKREECLNILHQKQIPIFPRSPPFIYLEQLAASICCICPEGNGIDTHRFWEALYLKSIPIVLRNELTEKLSNDFPCILLNSWEELSKDIFYSSEIQNKLNWLHTNTPDYQSKMWFQYYETKIQQAVASA